MTSSSSRPPRFVQCYVCHKQFGSHSIDIHEPKCLGKWRAFNATLPRNRREATPSPPPGHPHHQEHHLRPEMSPTPAAYTPTSDPDDLSSSWHDPQHQRLRRPRSASYGDLSAKNRPATATLKKPKVLDLSLRNAVDMSQMTRSMVDQLILSRDSQSGFSDYSSDFTSSSPSSVGSKSPFDDSGDSENESRRARPSTMRLPRPSRNIAVPVITSASRPTKRTSSLRSFIPRNRRRQVEEVFTGPKNKVKIPEPCLTCGKEQNPERFHSHPLHMQKFKPKSEDKNKSKQLNKLIVTKPTALKYKSKSFDDEKKSSGRKSKLKPPNAINLKSRSVDTSPVLTKKADAAEKTVPLKKFIQNQKASIAKGQKDFNIEIYGRDVSPSQQSENGISPLSQRKREVTVKQNKLNSEKSVSQQRASHPPRHIGKIEEESEGSCEPGSNSGSRGADSSQPGSNSGSRGADSSQPGSNSGSRGADSSQPGSNSGSRGADSSQPGSNSGSRGADSSHPSSNSGSRGADSSQPSSNRGSTAPTMVCYICGRGFGSKSLSIHEPQCLEKWKRENDRLPKQLRRAAPEKPDQPLTHEEWNKFAWDSAQVRTPGSGHKSSRHTGVQHHKLRQHNKHQHIQQHQDKELQQQEEQQPQQQEHPQQQHEEQQEQQQLQQEDQRNEDEEFLAQLVPCEWCGRTFFPERLEVHQRGCKPPPGAPKKTLKARPESSATVLNASMGPAKPTIVCYICGREFGSLSIAIHEPQCLRKWKVENENLPHHLQRPQPRKPDVIYDEGGNINREAMAEAAWQTHLEQLVKCEKCGRTFFPDRLIVHQKACLKDA